MEDYDEQLQKLESGPVHIVLRPNLRIRNKNRKASALVKNC